MLAIIQLLTLCSFVESGAVFFNANYQIINASLPNPNFLDVYYYDIRGIDFEFLAPIFYAEEGSRAVMRHNRFDFYSRGILMNGDDCTAEKFESRNIEYLANFGKSVLYFDVNSNKFKRPICPYVFKNAKIQTMIMKTYGDTYLYANTFTFYEVKNPKNLTLSLNATVQSLIFYDTYRNVFRQELSNHLFFSSVKKLTIQGIIEAIERDFFKNFTRLLQLILTLNNIGKFFQSSNNEWLQTVFINKKKFADRRELLSYISSGQMRFGDFYLILIGPGFSDLYPDEDFCLFKLFPRFSPVWSQLLLMSLNREIVASNYSCTYRFLSQNNLVLTNQLTPLFKARNIGLPNSTNFEETQLNECDFEHMLSICRQSSTSLKPSMVYSSITRFDVMYAFMWAEFVGPILTFPIFSAVAFILNFLIILIIKDTTNNKEKLFEAKTFRFIEMNSAFNCIECFIYQFRLMGICLGENSVYCSSIRTSPIYFYFGLMMLYANETFKSASMITGLFFSIQRYIESNKSVNTWLARFSRIQTRRFLLAALFYGLVNSLFVFFNVSFSQNEVDVYDTPSIFHAVDNYQNHKFETYIYFVHYIFNDLIILIMNLVVDCCLVRSIKAELRAKLQNKLKILKQDTSSNLKEPEKKRLKEEAKKKVSAERKANALIVVSIIIYICCRLPELVGVVFLYVHTYLKLGDAILCEMTIFCFTTLNMIEYLYMFAYIFNILIYYKFSMSFKKGFNSFFKR